MFKTEGQLVHFTEVVKSVCVELFVVLPYYSFDVCKDIPCFNPGINLFLLSLSLLLKIYQLY